MAIKKCPGCGLHYQMASSARRCDPCQERRLKAIRNSPDDLKKRAARITTKKAIAEGLLTVGPCVVCGAEPAEPHHVDYDDPLNIRWLCRRHHLQHHHDLRFRSSLEQGRWSAEEIKEIMGRRTAGRAIP